MYFLSTIKSTIGSKNRVQNECTSGRTNLSGEGNQSADYFHKSRVVSHLVVLKQGTCIHGLNSGVSHTLIHVHNL